MRLRSSRYSSSGRIQRLGEEKISQQRNAVSLKKPTKEEAEELITVDQKQFTPEDDNHIEEMKLKDEIHMKGEDSLTTKETKEAVQQRHSKEVFENKDATKKPNFRDIKQRYLNLQRHQSRLISPPFRNFPPFRKPFLKKSACLELRWS